MRNAEEQLQAAKAARAALEPEEREWPRAATYDGPEWLARNRDAIAPGRDTTEIAARITAAHEAERRQAS